MSDKEKNTKVTDYVILATKKRKCPIGESCFCLRIIELS
jgi:hypothetical protein